MSHAVSRDRAIDRQIFQPRGGAMTLAQGKALGLATNGTSPEGGEINVRIAA